MEFALSQAVASGDAFEHRPSECGHCVQDFLADLISVICLEKLRDLSLGRSRSSNGRSAFLSGCAGCTLWPPARPYGHCCGSGQYGDPERLEPAPIAVGSLRSLAAV